MKWLRAMLLRLLTGMLIGLIALIALGLFVLPGAAGSGVPSLLLLIAPAAGIGLVFVVVDGLQQLLWSLRWRPWADGAKPLPTNGEVAVKRALRGMNGPFSLPALAKRRTVYFVHQLAETLLKRKEREPWMWTVYALAWRHIRRYDSLLDATRDAIKESDSLNDTAWRVGLALLNERSDDTGLAIRLARSSLTRSLSAYPHDELRSLENAWLTAYQEDSSLRSVLLPSLTRRFLEVHRRDETAGWVYVDAFVHLTPTSELIAEMRATADAVDNTGGDPELVANLRALSSSDHGEPGAATRLAGDVVPAEHVRVDAEDAQDGPPVFMFQPRHTDAPPAAAADHPVEEGEDDDLTSSIIDNDSSKARLWLTIGTAVLVIALLAAIVYLTNGFGLLNREPTVEPAAEPVVDSTSVVSDLPYTVQIASLPEQDRAARLIRELRDQDVAAYLVVAEGNTHPWYQVRAGHFSAIPDGQAYGDSLENAGLIDDYYVARFEPGELPDLSAPMETETHASPDSSTLR